MYFYCFSHIQTSLTFIEDRRSEDKKGSRTLWTPIPHTDPSATKADTWGAMGGNQGALRGTPTN